jgi:tRNA threonylcarbamoyladenosine biosynthesis protein TsaE
MEIGRNLAEFLREGDILLLEGELGSGKTTLVRGIMQGLRNGDGSCVKSPSYTILNIYPPEAPEDVPQDASWDTSHDASPGLVVHHFDFYRVENEADLEELGLNDYWGEGVCVVEWPKRFCHLLPGRIIDLEIVIGEGDQREIALSPIAIFEKERDAPNRGAPDRGAQ